jgi:CRISPR-associated protein Csb1
MDFEALKSAVATHAAFRRRQRLQPIGGPGDKIFPPTYPGEGRNAPPVHVLERRRIDGSDVWCALVDSVQSQANRMEEALRMALAGGSVEIPHLTVDFTGTGLAGITAITSLDAPHRIYDAILRDSLLDGQPFPASPLGRGLAQARVANATAVLQASPTALVFGAWNSTGEGGGMGAKFPRVLVSEIIAVGVPVEQPRELDNEGRGNARPNHQVEVFTAGRRTGSRIDPLGVLRQVEVYQGDGKAWDVTQAGAGKRAKKVRPSEINHGKIPPSITQLGITCDHLEHTAVLSFAALRRLGFGSAQSNTVAQAFLAALGLLSLLEQDAIGYALRSRCDLVCSGLAPLGLVGADGSIETINLTRSDARALYASAVDAARAAGFDLASTPVTLRPQDKLVAIVQRSQELALAGKGGETDSV